VSHCGGESRSHRQFLTVYQSLFHPLTLGDFLLQLGGELMLAHHRQHQLLVHRGRLLMETCGLCHFEHDSRRAFTCAWKR